MLEKRALQLGLGRNALSVARWLSGIASGVPSGSMVIHAGRDRGAREIDGGRMRRDHVADALEQLRACGLIHRVQPSRGGRRAHGWMLGDLVAAAPAPSPAYARRLERRGAWWRPVRDSETDSERDRETDSDQGLGEGLGKGPASESLSPKGGPEVTYAAHGAAVTEAVPAAPSRGTPTSDRPPGDLPSHTAAPSARASDGVGEAPDLLGCGCELGYLGGVRVVVVPCSREHDR